MKQLLIIMVFLTSVYGLEPGQIFENEQNQYQCKFNILYYHYTRYFGVIYNAKTDKPYHCENYKRVEGSLISNGYTSIKITK